MNTTIIEFTYVVKKTGETFPKWVKSVAFKDGPGYQVKSMVTTRDRDQAARFSLAAAHEIAEQFYTSPAKLQAPDGTLKTEETAKLQKRQLERVVKHYRLQQEANDEMRAFLNGIPADLQASLKSIGVRW
jgi:hypothetical protein